MIVTDIIPCGKRKSKVLTDEDLAFSVYQSELRKLGLETGKEISEALRQEQIFPLLRKRAKERALRLLRDRDYTEAGLLEKLRSGDCPEAVAKETVQWAKQKRYVEDLRYAEQFIACHAAGKSRQRILFDLSRKGIPREQAEQLLDENPPDEEAQILKELRKSRFSEKQDDPRERNRILSRLARRGYQWGEIERVIREWQEPDAW